MKDAEKIINAVNKYFRKEFDVDDVVHNSTYEFSDFFKENILYRLLGNPYGTVNSEDAAEFMAEFKEKTGFNLVKEFSKIENTFLQTLLIYNNAFGIWN